MVDKTAAFAYSDIKILNKCRERKEYMTGAVQRESVVG
jgi:hypothetical protein